MTEPTVMYTPELQGEKDKPFPGTAEIVTLRDDPESGAATYLVRLPAGGQIVPHSHAASAQHYVLEGECESEGTVRRTGTYHLIPPHATVGPVTTRDGAAILIILDPSVA